MSTNMDDPIVIQPDQMPYPQLQMEPPQSAPHPAPDGSIDLDDLVSGERTFTARWTDKEGIARAVPGVVYNPRAVTAGVTQDDTPNLESSARLACKLLLRWPLRKNGQPIPVTVEAITQDVPLDVLSGIIIAILNDAGTPQGARDQTS